MKVIVAGSRSIAVFGVVCDALAASPFSPSEVVSGTARGVDRMGERWAREAGVAVKRFPAQWDRFGKSAGYRRNEQMARYADALVAVWDGHSRGTGHMIDLARKYNLAVYVHRLDVSSDPDFF